MPIDAGKLDRRITIQRLSRTYNADRQPVETWCGWRRVWASRRRASANERLAGGQVTAQITDVFEVRLEPEVEDVSTKDRLLCDGRAYDIVEVSVQGNDGLMIRATARAD